MTYRYTRDHTGHFLVGPFLDASTGLPLTGLTQADLDAADDFSILEFGSDSVAGTLLTLNTPSTNISTFTHATSGYYWLDFSIALFTSVTSESRRNGLIVIRDDSEWVTVTHEFTIGDTLGTDANIRWVNGVEVDGTGASGDEWGPA